MPWVASPWSRWRTRRWRPQRSLTSGSKSAQKQGSQNFVVKGYHCPEIWLFASVLSGMRRTRNSGVACWGRCVTRPVPPACPCASTPPGCPNCRQNHFLSLSLLLHSSLCVSFPVFVCRADLWHPFFSELKDLYLYYKHLVLLPLQSHAIPTVFKKKIKKETTV